MNISKINLDTKKRVELVNVTEKINEAIDFDEGWVFVFSKHTTSGLTINEDEKRLREDIKKALKELISGSGWRHNEIDNNADSHLRGMLLDSSLVMPVENGSLDLGTWQSVFFVELDGPRTRKVLVGSSSPE